MIFEIILAIIVFVAIAKYLQRWNQCRDVANLPGPSSLPIVGTAHHVFALSLTKFTKQYLQWALEYGSPMRMQLMHSYWITISKAEHFEEVLKNSENIDKSSDYEFIEPWLGTGLLISTGRKWHSHRKLLTPAFHFQILKDFVPIYNEQASQMVQILFQKIDQTNTIDISPLITLCTLDIICETAMGIQINAQHEDSEYIRAIKSFGDIAVYRITQPYLWPEFIFTRLPCGKESARSLKILHTFTKKVIEDRENENLDKNEAFDDSGHSRKKRGLAFLDLLLEMKKNGQLTMEEVREEVDTFMFEGHDTTATGLMWALWCIAAHQPVQDRLVQEINEVLADYKNPDAYVPYEKIPQLKYLECVLKVSRRQVSSY